MTHITDSDCSIMGQAKSLALPFASSDVETSGIRTTRAEFARMMDCSRQAVTDWVKSGRITVGADGRFDPRHAVRSLLATGDPAKIRARILAPLVSEMDALRRKNFQLEHDLAAAQENAEFQEGAAHELLEIIQALKANLTVTWPSLRAADPDLAIAAIERWIESAETIGGDPGLLILQYLPSAARDECVKGNGGVSFRESAVAADADQSA